MTAPGNFIRYEVPPMVSGWVEFDTSGLRESNSSPNQFMLFGMWDPSAGSYRNNPFRVHLQKLHPNPHNPPYLRLRWIANGEQHDEGNNFLDWNQERTYHWRVEWGPSGGSHTAQVFLDGQLMITVNYNRAYSSNMLFIELGVGELFVVPRGVEHKPVAAEFCHVLLFEPSSTRTTGALEHEHAIEPADLERI